MTSEWGAPIPKRDKWAEASERWAEKPMVHGQRVEAVELPKLDGLGLLLTKPLTTRLGRRRAVQQKSSANYRRKNPEAIAAYEAKRRADPAYRERQRQRNKAYRDMMKNDPAWVEKRREASRQKRRIKMQDPEWRAKDLARLRTYSKARRAALRDNGNGSRSSIGLSAGPRGSSSEGEG